MLRDVEDCPNVRRVLDELIAVVKQLVAKELMKLVQETLNGILHTLYHNVQSGILFGLVERLGASNTKSIAYGLHWSDPDSHIVKFFNTHAPADRLSEERRPSSTLMALIATSVCRKTDSTIADPNTVIAKPSKKKPVAAMEK